MNAKGTGYVASLDPATSGAVVLPNVETDTNYIPLLSVYDASAGATAASKRVRPGNLTVNGFDIILEAAPGGGQTIFVGWVIVGR